MNLELPNDVNLLIGAFIATCCLATPVHAGQAPAFQQPRGVLRPSGGDRVVQQIVTRIRADADALRQALDASRPRQGRYRQSPGDDIQYAIDDVVTAADHLSDHLDRRQVIQVDVDDLMRRGAALEQGLANARSAPPVHTAWTTLQRDLTEIASAYGQTWNWRNPTYAPLESAGGYYQSLTGTYELDASRSDDPRRIASQALGRSTAAERARLGQDLESRLYPPDQIALDRVGDRITLASSQGPRITLDANGRVLAERGGGARDMTTRASIYGDRFEVGTNGAPEGDYSATFEPLDGGQSLRLTKRLFDDSVSQPIVIQSVYRRVSETPDWNLQGGRNGQVRNNRGARQAPADGTVPDGTILMATLDQPLNIRTVRVNDRVSLTVQNAPSPTLDGAVLEGYLTTAGAHEHGAPDMTIAFNRIRLRNGRTATFAGTIENVRGPNGEPVSFNGESVGNDANTRNDAIQRGAIGAAIGAVIGALADGGQGAAIGAAVGAGGGAATVLIGGRQQTELPRGTEFTIRARGTF